MVVAALLPEFVSVLFFPFPLSLCNPTPREGKLGASKIWNLMNHIFDRGLRMSGEGGGNGGRVHSKKVGDLDRNFVLQKPVGFFSL